MQLSTGDELWKRDLEDTIEMMPARFGDGLGEIAFTLDNYRAPLMLDGRLYLFYDGATSYDARTGKEKEREKFKVNEDGLALTEADPVVDDSRVYVSGRGRVRAVNRRTGDIDWKADDLGISAEMAQVGNVLYVRTGGQFTRLSDGEIQEKGPFGVSAIDTRSGKTLWRYKGADKGLTNFVFADAGTILIADKDDLITLDARTGKERSKRGHKVEKAQFVLVNESGQAVVGGAAPHQAAAVIEHVAAQDDLAEAVTVEVPHHRAVTGPVVEIAPHDGTAGQEEPGRGVAGAGVVVQHVGGAVAVEVARQ